MHHHHQDRAPRDRVCPQLVESVGEPLQYSPDGGPDGLAVGAEAIALQGGGHRGGGDVAGDGTDEHDDTAGVATAGECADGDTGESADGGGDGARCRRERVRGHQQRSLHHMGQGGGDPGEDEPADAEHDEHGDGEGEPFVPLGDEHGDRHHDHGPDQVRVDQDLSATPPVEEHARERADEGVGQEQHHERTRHARRGRLAFGGEQHEGGECGLQEPVGGLAEQAGGVEAPEVADRDDGPQVGQRHIAKAIGRCAAPGPG